MILFSIVCVEGGITWGCYLLPRPDISHVVQQHRDKTALGEIRPSGNHYLFDTDIMACTIFCLGLHRHGANYVAILT